MNHAVFGHKSEESISVSPGYEPRL